MSTAKYSSKCNSTRHSSRSLDVAAMSLPGVVMTQVSGAKTVVHEVDRRERRRVGRWTRGGYVEGGVMMTVS